MFDKSGEPALGAPNMGSALRSRVIPWWTVAFALSSLQLRTWRFAGRTDRGEHERHGEPPAEMRHGRESRSTRFDGYDSIP